MGVFISWSGNNTRSHQVAEVLRRWLGQVIQGCDPWTSSQDIDAGQQWATELFTQLDNHKVGIICVTKANKDEPWLNFEAGALAKQLKGDKPDESRVCPLLIDMTASDVTGPLKLLQMVPLDKDGMRKVLQMVNKYSMQKPLTDEVLNRAFEKWWPDLKSDLDAINVPEEQPKKSSRPVEEMLEEILTIVRSVDREIYRTPPPLGREVRSPVSEFKKLYSEVRRIDQNLANVLVEADVDYEDNTLKLALRESVPAAYLAKIAEAANRVGIKLEVHQPPSRTY